ncbi:MAG: sensor histidine kinase N-terminal domain-containing protein [Thiobacillus sp.]|nr:sensor histidine kinase N-terminal domain-containing protein [Thiobacillus sp.]
MRRTERTLAYALLGWLLIPLVALLAVSAYTTYRNAYHLAETERDLVLEEITDDLQDFVSATLGARRTIDPDSLTFSLLVRDALDQRYFAIYDAQGALLAGDRRLTRMPAPVGKHAVFDTIFLDGKTLRRAVLKGERNGFSDFEIQVAETMVRRDRLTLHLLRGVLVPQALALVLSLPLIWFGISRGLRPLEELRRRITHRSAQDFDAIPVDDIPRELLPVVAALNDLLLRFRAVREEQRRFTADAAHQIKTPLAVLTAEIELARADAACPCAQPTYDRLQKAVLRLTHLVRQLLALAHSEANESTAHGLFDLSELAREVTGGFVAAAARRGIDLGFEGTEQAIPVRGNVVLIREAMKNLLENALKFTPAGGTVTVSTRNFPPVFAVADSGPGIADAELPLIFKRFHRTPESSTVEGSGLGLAIVQEVARKHGAIVTAGTSTLGGALFEFRFEDQSVSRP